MIISCSRRTDIPAAHAAWLMQRISMGYCDVPNPMNPHQISRVSLRPEDVDIFVFWTKNPAPLMPHLEELNTRGYRYYFLYTLNGYDRLLEPHVPELASGIQIFRDLAGMIGPEKVIWRYDPIIITQKMNAAYHVQRFGLIARALSGFTRRAIISLVDFYKKKEPGFRALEREGHSIERDLSRPEILADLIPGLAAAAHNASMEIQSCAEKIDLRPYGIQPGKCIDNAFIERVFGIQITAAKDPAQRPYCGCIKSRDIGVYNTCSAGCIYCYATS